LIKGKAMETEIIRGFVVKKTPQKPDYLPITQEDFKQKTLTAWCESEDESSRIAAVFRGGEQEWAALIHDESWKVRAALACRASEQYQLFLAADTEPVVRRCLAKYGTDKVRNMILYHVETDPEVIAEIAKYGSTNIRKRLIQIAWDSPNTLRQITRYLPASSIEKLLTHPDIDVRIDAALHGNREQCMQVLQTICSSSDPSLVLMRDGLTERINELDKVAQAIQFGRTRTQKISETERTI